MKPIALLPLLACLALPLPALAQSALEDAQSCLSDHTSGKDRKLLGRWIFLAIGAHPEIARLSNATPADHEATSKEFADLLTRLVTEDCAGPLRTLASADGADSMRLAFEYLGGIAMQELMGNDKVNAAISGFEKHVDQRKLAEVFAGDKGATGGKDTSNKGD